MSQRAEKDFLAEKQIAEDAYYGIVGAPRQHFSEAQMVEPTGAVALENFLSKFKVPQDVESGVG